MAYRGWIFGAAFLSVAVLALTQVSFKQNSGRLSLASQKNDSIPLQCHQEAFAKSQTYTPNLISDINAPIFHKNLPVCQLLERQVKESLKKGGSLTENQKVLINPGLVDSATSLFNFFYPLNRQTKSTLTNFIEIKEGLINYPRTELLRILFFDSSVENTKNRVYTTFDWDSFHYGSDRACTDLKNKFAETIESSSDKDFDLEKRNLRIVGADLFLYVRNFIGTLLIEKKRKLENMIYCLDPNGETRLSDSDPELPESDCGKVDHQAFVRSTLEHHTNLRHFLGRVTFDTTLSDGEIAHIQRNYIYDSLLGPKQPERLSTEEIEELNDHLMQTLRTHLESVSSQEDIGCGGKTDEECLKWISSPSVSTQETYLEIKEGPKKYKETARQRYFDLLTRFPLLALLPMASPTQMQIATAQRKLLKVYESYEKSLRSFDNFKLSDYPVFTSMVLSMVEPKYLPTYCMVASQMMNYEQKAENMWFATKIGVIPLSLFSPIWAVGLFYPAAELYETGFGGEFPAVRNLTPRCDTSLDHQNLDCRVDKVNSAHDQIISLWDVAFGFLMLTEVTAFSKSYQAYLTRVKAIRTGNQSIKGPVKVNKAVPQVNALEKAKNLAAHGAGKWALWFERWKRGRSAWKNVSQAEKNKIFSAAASAKKASVTATNGFREFSFMVRSFAKDFKGFYYSFRRQLINLKKRLTAPVDKKAVAEYLKNRKPSFIPGGKIFSDLRAGVHGQGARNAEYLAIQSAKIVGALPLMPAYVMYQIFKGFPAMWRRLIYNFRATGVPEVYSALIVGHSTMIFVSPASYTTALSLADVIGPWGFTPGLGWGEGVLLSSVPLGLSEPFMFLFKKIFDARQSYSWFAKAHTASFLAAKGGALYLKFKQIQSLWNTRQQDEAMMLYMQTVLDEAPKEWSNDQVTTYLALVQVMLSLPGELTIPQRILLAKEIAKGQNSKVPFKLTQEDMTQVTKVFSEVVYEKIAIEAQEGAR